MNDHDIGETGQFQDTTKSWEVVIVSHDGYRLHCSLHSHHHRVTFSIMAFLALWAAFSPSSGLTSTLESGVERGLTLAPEGSLWGSAGSCSAVHPLAVVLPIFLRHICDNV